jgi:hypothetical protein
MILRLVEKLKETGSLQSEKGRHNPKSRVPQCAEEVRERLIHSPRKSLRRLSQETSYSLTMCQTTVKHEKIRPYRVTAVHELIGPNKIVSIIAIGSSGWWKGTLEY